MERGNSLLTQPKKRIAVIMPARDSSKGIVNGSGIVSEAIRDDFLAQLRADDAVGEVVPVTLAGAYVENGDVYANGHCLSDMDIVFWLYYVGDNFFEWDMLHTLMQTTTVLPNPKAAFRTRNKFYAHTKIRNAGVPTADFCAFAAADAEAMAEKLADWGDVVLKPVHGDFGHGICKVSNKRAFVDTIAYAQSFSREPLDIFCERFEKNDITKWISATVIDGDVVFGYRKRPTSFVEGWKVYDAGRIGGNADHVDPEPVREIAAAAAEALGCDIVGFDLILSERHEDYIIVDENTLPGMYADCFDAAGKGSLADHLARMVLKRIGE